MVSSNMSKAAISFVAAAVVSSGCLDYELDGPPYRAQIVDVVDIDPETSRPSFALAVREFALLEDLDTLSSPELQVLRGGELLIREVPGGFVADRMTADPNARLRYVDDNGVAVARDYATLAMLSAYYHYERVLLDLERVTGITLNELGNRFGTVEVFFEPAFRTVGSDIDERDVFKHNAFYLPGARQFGIAQRSPNENVPFAVNPMVTAHEFGHALFELTFDHSSPGSCNPTVVEENEEDPLFPGRFRVEYAISGMNEGFADFVSFAYLGATNALAEPSVATAERNFAAPDFAFGDLIPPEDDDSWVPPCFGQFYCMGTLFASALYRTMIDLDYDPLDANDRGEFSRMVIDALTSTQEAMRELPEGIVPPPDLGAAQCRRHEGMPREIDGEVAGAFLAAFASQVPDDVRGPLCEVLIRRFGDRGFPEHARVTCPSESTDDSEGGAS
jgi:hypothetical protein